MISHSRGIGGTGPLMRDTAGQGTDAAGGTASSRPLKGSPWSLNDFLEFAKEHPLLQSGGDSRLVVGRAAGPGRPILPLASSPSWRSTLHLSPEGCLGTPRPLPSKAGHPRGLPDSGFPAAAPGQRRPHLQARARFVGCTGPKGQCPSAKDCLRPARPSAIQK